MGHILWVEHPKYMIHFVGSREERKRKPTHFSSTEQSPVWGDSYSLVFRHSKSTVFIPHSSPTCRASQSGFATYLSYQKHAVIITLKWDTGRGGDTCLIQRGSVISCERTHSAVGAVRPWQRWVWALCNYVGLMVCLRNSQWWCLMIILIPGSFAKGVYILHNSVSCWKYPSGTVEPLVLL